ncbi:MULTISPECIES: rod shape-determining protein RodA [unclassified Brevundimonas]|uniref:rod shape-determining protein RodA n=1 Tax=unclassified Brevundimonas TaxID=2622653 RepID=UPI000CFE075C|nr:MULTISPECIES: rod shape-determining protein RodA [unclassified Brevundimonas]PRA30938.1 rod shape-determining protein RodA [Brevundimonas sp. MYb27]PQZ82803.1 rod shape-determining protein RodA [Brevundimonas sp. MYb31]PRB16802.1 rod shape-determining protein RodA [Brevundimonas sp. MYb52]PRB34662.1 rod shape-determining protein RodA [Brevundimonas sp. MYb46]PRB54772.1 rod shape-determining protein RodA [Brevundimonas sp. MYb33]
MTASALTRPGERDRISSKLAELDWRVIGLLCVLAGIGTAMLYSIAGGSWSPWAWKHLLRFGVLLVAMIGLAMVHPKWWFHAAYPVYGLLLFMVLLIEFTPMGYVAGGAKNWLNLGFIRIQPAEFMKIGLVLALARWYHGHSAQDARWSWKLLFPLGMIGVPFLLVAKQPDLGSAMIIGLTGAAVMFMAGLSWRVIAAAAAAAVAIIPPFVMFVMHDYQRNRVLTFLNPEADPSGTGYNIIQSKIALGSGGLLGKGYGLGSQSQLEFLPERHTDFIFSTVSEEFGFLGSFTVLACYLALILISLRIAALSHSHFGRISAAGMTAFLALFVLINGAMVMGLAPVVGVPMPLLSYGGSTMMTVMIGFGLILSTHVHRYVELPKGQGLF